jgi:hypothetical protein
VSDGLGFMNKGSLPTTRQEASLKLISEYRRARKRHEILIRRRLIGLFRALAWLAASIGTSFLAVMISFVSLAIHKEPLTKEEAPKAIPSPC